MGTRVPFRPLYSMPLVAGGGCWWLVVVAGGWWWLVVAGGGWWWLVVAGGGWWWLVVAGGGKWLVVLKVFVCWMELVDGVVEGVVAVRLRSWWPLEAVASVG